MQHMHMSSFRAALAVHRDELSVGCGGCCHLTNASPVSAVLDIRQMAADAAPLNTIREKQ